MKICSVGAELFRADTWMDMMNLSLFAVLQTCLKMGWEMYTQHNSCGAFTRI